jgi:hypothetical protein
MGGKVLAAFAVVQKMGNKKGADGHPCIGLCHLHLDFALGF